jgi:NAD(P)-dependent dehydrogenase (short-subunit alcohol dehydrogenase family)
MDHFLPVTEYDDATFERVMAVNVGGPFRTCRAVLPSMIEAGGGAIVNIASIAGMIGSAAGATYTASKHAVVGLTRHISYYYAEQGIRCNAVAPGAVSTNIITSSMPPQAAQWAFDRAQVAMARSTGVAEPDQIASLVSWLGCDEASNVNGAIVPADRGWTAS